MAMKGSAKLLLLCLALALSGCRARTMGPAPGGVSSQAPAGETDAARQGEQLEAEGAFSDASETENRGESGEPTGPTKENPEASRKEYDENAAAEIVPGTDRLLHGDGEGSGAPIASPEAPQPANQLNSQAEEPATQTVAAQEAEEMGVSEDGEAADSAMTYYTVLLRDRMGSLFECQRANVYWETAQDHVTVHKTAPEHALILNAGLYDVSARLLPENLRVDDGWVARKNPGVIVKVVEGGILGSSVHSAGAAEAVYRQLLGREGWGAIDAVKNRRVLLLSQELLEAPYLQTAAMVMLAQTASPALFSDVDAEEALSMLLEEATGSLPTGLYFYRPAN